MSWDLNSDRPVYLQIVEKIQIDIVSGIYKAGDKLPSVRDLAATAAVNPNTMQKALTELERTGLVYANRTSGRFITDDAELLTKAKKDLASMEVAEFLSKMRKFGFTKEEVLNLVSELYKEDTL